MEMNKMTKSTSVVITPSTSLTFEGSEKLKKQPSTVLIVYGPETLREMLYKFPFADGYVVELGAKIYLKKNVFISLPGMIKTRGWCQRREKTIKRAGSNVLDDLRGIGGLNVLNMSTGEVAARLGVSWKEASLMKMREFSALLLSDESIVDDLQGVWSWKMKRRKYSLVAPDFYACGLLEELSEYYNVEFLSLGENDTPCFFKKIG